MNAAPENVDQYIQGFPPEIQAVLEEVRRTVLRSVPGGEERISYRMPAVFNNGVVVYYAAFKKHLGLFPPVADPRLQAKVARYAGPKGNLQFPYTESIPYGLIAEIAGARLKANLAKVAKAAPKSAKKPSR